MARKIERLTYINERGESVEFSHVSIYHTNQISGLSDIYNAIYSINSMGQDGDTYLGSRIESREIEVVGKINERKKDFMQNHRRNLNHILNPQLSGMLVYEYGDFKRVIDCKVERLPYPAEKVILQDFIIQFVCHNPFWRKENETRNDIATWVGNFEFPEEIPMVEGWEIGYREPSLIVNVFNEGDVQSGLRAEFRALGVTSDPMLLNIDTGEFIKFNNINLVAGDVLFISTGYGKKEVTFLHNGVISDAFRYLDEDSSYIQLEVGDNLLKYEAGSNLENLEVSIYHDDLYTGV